MVRVIAAVALLSLACSCSKEPAPPVSQAPAQAQAQARSEDTPGAGFEPPVEEVVAFDAVTPFKGDLEEIQQRGVLRILIVTPEEEQLPRLGFPSSQERELARAFAELIGTRAQFVATESWDALLPALLDGKGDVIASNLTVTPARSQQVAFTRPVAVVSEWIVGKRGAKKPPRDAKGLAGREVHVRPSSAFNDTLQALARTTAPRLKIVPVPEHLDSESIAYEVGRGERPLTVLDSHLLEAMRTYNDELVGLFPIAEGRQIAWATRKENAKLRSAIDAFLIQKSLTGHTEQRFTGDLDGIRKRGVLRVLTRNNPATYFLYQGQQQGFDYELVALAARALKVRLEMVVPPSRDLLVPWLEEGRGDLIAASFSITPQRRERVAFTTPYLHVDEVLVQRRGETPLSSLGELKGRRIHLRRSSSHWSTLEALQARHGPFELVPESEELETEELIAAVASGELPLTVADSHVLALELKFRADVQPALSLTATSARPEGTGEIAFGLRKTNPQLKAFLDGFVKRTYRGLEYNVARKRYFESPAQIARSKTERAGLTGDISPYDALFQKYSTRYSLDWRLMAAQAYQESRYDPKARSWVGARGLFQVMPATGKELGFDDLDDPEQGVHAGVRYMHKLINQFEPSLPFRQRVRFALASYNAGYGHVQDARRLAAERGLDPNRWFENVERTMLLLEQPRHYRRARHGYCRGSEPVKYVSEIQNRYDNYVKLLAAAPEP